MTTMCDKSIQEFVSNMPREECIELLESICIQCNVDEPTYILREAVAVNIIDGTLQLC